MCFLNAAICQSRKPAQMHNNSLGHNKRSAILSMRLSSRKVKSAIHNNTIVEQEHFLSRHRRSNTTV
jgi:hypothetical protein